MCCTSCVLINVSCVLIFLKFGRSMLKKSHNIFILYIALIAGFSENYTPVGVIVCVGHLLQLISVPIQLKTAKK